MNKERRKQIDGIIARIEQELSPLVDELRGAIEEVRDEEQEYFDNMPESLQGGDKGNLAEAAVDALEEAVSGFDDLDLEGLINNLYTAQE